ncbi:fatty acid desaturase [Phenylobacterium sp.]|uniref:fatty acid desaturase n=1 Tax=Phenylobacterium sp. TaxID=1871053 RepID=UPI001220DAC0|nr:fatty acid desaturase [Phenylobacterium sp.]THD61586.1 MAG: fatty acid desaturase [Phenylobacterium sp.]
MQSIASRRNVEWLTVGLAVAVYGGWMAVTLLQAHLPTPVLAVLGGWLIAWQGSLQHEIIHGHPTASRRLNEALGAAPLSLWLPFTVYRRSHLLHHACEHLAHPDHDPEARYLGLGSGWRHRTVRFIAGLQATLIGRLLVGPFVEVARLGWDEARRVARGEPGARAEWAAHAAGVAVVMTWLIAVCQLSLARYLLCFVYPGIALSLLRSFAEHRADATPGGQVAVVENAPVLGLLFLNNNLHAAHHAWPTLPWWRLPARYRIHRPALLSANGGLVYDGYGEVFARFAVRPHHTLEHPAFAPPTGEAAA